MTLFTSTMAGLGAPSFSSQQRPPSGSQGFEVDGEDQLSMEEPSDPAEADPEAELHRLVHAFAAGW